jgi:RNA polymerase sigma factor (sigma-70 family)
MDDDEMGLLDRWCAGDRGAGSELFKRYFAAVYRFFDHKTDKDADDLVQETFLACVRERDRFQRQSSFRTYLFSIARYTLYGYWRTTSRRVPVIDFDEISVASLSTSAPGRLARHNDHSKLLAALRELPLEASCPRRGSIACTRRSPCRARRLPRPQESRHPETTAS